jgi:hypothetical protein
MELAPLDSKDYCPRRAALGSGKNEQHSFSKSAQAAPAICHWRRRLGNALRDRCEIFSPAV